MISKYRTKTLLFNFDTHGNDGLVFYIPEGEEWLIQTVYLELTSSSTLGDRNFSIDFYQSGKRILSTTNDTPYSATTTGYFTFSDVIADHGIEDSHRHAPLPDIAIGTNGEIRFAGEGGKTGDFGHMVIHYKLLAQNGKLTEGED